MRTGFHGDKLEDKKNVIFIERNVESLKEAIRFLWENPGVYTEISNASRVFAEKHHDITKVAQQWKDAIDRELLK